jgi:hypothetical protein
VISMVVPAEAIRHFKRADAARSAALACLGRFLERVTRSVEIITGGRRFTCARRRRAVASAATADSEKPRTMVVILSPRNTFFCGVVSAIDPPALSARQSRLGWAHV